jgi:hypothetical protein
MLRQDKKYPYLHLLLVVRRKGLSFYSKGALSLYVPACCRQDGKRVYQWD